MKNGIFPEVWEQIQEDVASGIYANTLIVADFSQLELRVMAHLANCASMLEGFRLGGDFHSRTAMEMYQEVLRAVERGDCTIAKDGTGRPTVKEMFGFERGRGKTLNFAIMYGKSAYGFAQDWGVSKEEAQGTIDKWYEPKPEVRAWQNQVIQKAYETGYVRTLFGRYMDVSYYMRSHLRGLQKAGERKVVNGPVQGGAADIVNRAMLKVEADPWLRGHGYRLLFQVHDELIVEGPRRWAESSMRRIVRLMSEPFKDALRVALIVDANFAPTWSLAK